MAIDKRTWKERRKKKKRTITTSCVIVIVIRDMHCQIRLVIFTIRDCEAAAIDYKIYDLDPRCGNDNRGQNFTFAENDTSRSNHCDLA